MLVCDTWCLIEWSVVCVLVCFFFFQAEDGIRDLVRSRGLGDVYKRQVMNGSHSAPLMISSSIGTVFEAVSLPWVGNAAPPLSLIHI